MTTKIALKNIHPLTDFLRNHKAHIAQLKESGQPEILTVNGKAEVVVLDAETYEKLAERIEHMDFINSLREGIEEVEAGGGYDLDEIEAEIKERYGI